MFQTAFGCHLHSGDSEGHRHSGHAVASVRVRRIRLRPAAVALAASLMPPSFVATSVSKQCIAASADESGCRCDIEARAANGTVPAWSMNITFAMKRKGKKQFRHEIHDVQDLTVERVAEARQRFEANRAAFTMAAIRSPEVAAIAAVTRKQLQMALAESDLPPDQLNDMLDNGFRKYFDSESDQLLGSISSHQLRSMLQTMRLALSPLQEAIGAVAAEVALPCPASYVHCGEWDWYLRGLVKKPSVDCDFFSSIHSDGKLMLGTKSRKMYSALWPLDCYWAGPGRIPF
eukprot:gnl/TRDRNA2_/TRDRNA2_170561_c5_seq6.p1 gnl/TRDRNA2_/TRDRNA2_170561_c5~~gnl/TRDRNA2_/TRDRNA2_170561_c5_seq6.p1  ORF type:complete len:289 (-),score=47.83 gnl/TRDRNA2_/TRDRNA2_170561_c5_seq6:5-871(-)